MSSAKQFRQTLFLILFSLVLLLTGCGGAPARVTTEPTRIPPTTTPIVSGWQIVFTSDRDGNNEIYIMNADGSGQTNLTNHEASDERPSISPDRKRVAFISDRDGNQEIYLINAEGTGLTRLTDTPEWEDFPRWSPDGRHIVFIREFNVVVMDPDGSNQTNLTSEPWADGHPVYMLDKKHMPGADLYPAWTSDGTQVVFLSVRDRTFQYYVVNIDGTQLTILDSGLPPSEVMPEQVVYLLTAGLDKNYLTGSGDFPQQMNDTGLALGELPVWSSDGTWIAFHSDRDGDMEIYAVRADRSEIVQLTDNEVADLYSTWSPDGTRIAFVSDRDGDLEIYIMNADGTEQTQLTNNSASDYQPSWYR